MGFFKLGKLDRKEKKTTEDASGEAASSAPGAGDGLQQEATRYSKKKQRDDGDGGASSGGAAALPSAEGRSGPGVTTRVQAGLSVNDFISKTKNQQRQGLKPSGPELIAYARYLGIDPVADHDLLWIAVEALEAPLPSDWTEHFDSSDRVFYYNATSRVSSWTHPLEHVYRETYKTIVVFRNSNMSPQERSEGLHRLQQEVRQMDQETQKEVAKWSEHSDEQGNRFYFNKEERQSTWTDPRPAKCQVLYLKMKMLRLLLSSAAGTPGFVDPSKGDVGGVSRFGAMLGGSDFGEPSSSKRMPLPGAHGGGGGGGSSRPERQAMPQVSSAPNEVIDLSADGGPEEHVSPLSPRTSEGSNHGGSDSDSDGKKKKKKHKKHKKKKKKQSDEAMPGTPPLRPEAQKLLGAGPPTAGGVGSASGSGAGSISDEGGSGFGDHGEVGGSKAAKGHTKVKAGIKLQPLSALGGPGPLAGSREDSGPSGSLEHRGGSMAAPLEAIRGPSFRGGGPGSTGPSMPYP